MRNFPNKVAEVKYYGLHACLALWKKRPEDVIRVYLEERLLKTLSPLLKWCAQQKKAYHIVTEEEMRKITDSVHHEGVSLLAKAPFALTEEAFLSSLQAQKIPLFYLDGVQNPHNVGSLLRTAAHFGVPYILGEKGKLPSLSPSACRIAKGGAESVQLVILEQPLKTFSKLKQKGFQLIATSSHKGNSLYQFSYPPRSILVLGGESEGIGKDLLKLAPHLVSIPGTGEVESLNVSAAASILIGEYARQHQ